MRFSPVLCSMLALSTAALAADNRVVATKVEGVTLEQIKAATTPINVAKFDVDGAHMGVRCAGSTGQLICETWNLDRNEIVAASSDLKLCRNGTDWALMGDKLGAGRVIVLPGTVVVGDATKLPVCGG
jgi:hypothetical protein